VFEALAALHSSQFIASQKYFTLKAFHLEAARTPLVWFKRAAAC
jgi:hypothetical protein